MRYPLYTCCLNCAVHSWPPGHNYHSSASDTDHRVLRPEWLAHSRRYDNPASVPSPCIERGRKGGSGHMAPCPTPLHPPATLDSEGWGSQGVWELHVKTILNLTNRRHFDFSGWAVSYVILSRFNLILISACLNIYMVVCLCCCICISMWLFGSFSPLCALVCDVCVRACAHNQACLCFKFKLSQCVLVCTHLQPEFTARHRDNISWVHQRAGQISPDVTGPKPAPCQFCVDRRFLWAKHTE